MKGAGITDTRENCWKFFVDRARRQLKVVLCFSPVGSTLRIRSRKFPALVSCTSIIWFHEWPQEALISVSMKFLADVEVLPVGEIYIWAIMHAVVESAFSACVIAIEFADRIEIKVYERVTSLIITLCLQNRNLLVFKFVCTHPILSLKYELIMLIYQGLIFIHFLWAPHIF